MEHLTVKVSTDIKEMRKYLKVYGWVSAHYLTRHGWNVNALRAKAKKNEIKSLQVHTFGTTTWYYSEDELNNLPQAIDSTAPAQADTEV